MRPFRRNVFPVILLIFLGTVSFIETNDEATSALKRFEVTKNQKLWSASDKLTWDDFQGKRDKRNGHDAVTHATLKTQPIIFTENKVQYELVAIFDKKKSWTTSDSEALLVHEQIHFDIAELVIRQMRKKFMKHRFRSLDGVNKMINATFSEAAKEHVRLNKEYDKETNHSRNKPKQLLWEDRIQRELKTLNDYSSTRVTITK